MRERPMLFSAPMVRAILADEKTMTRRAIKPQPRSNGTIVNARAGEILCEDDYLPPSALLWDVGKHRVTVCDLDGSLQLCCPYGVVGDRLWVRETWRSETSGGAKGDDSVSVKYAADGAVRRFEDRDVGAAWVEPRACLRGVNAPGIHMPRWASRITLEVTSVRVEPLQDITDADAEQEGCVVGAHAFDCNSCDERYGPVCGDSSYRETFERLWKSINGDESWSANPYVWAVGFKRIDAAPQKASEAP